MTPFDWLGGEKKWQIGEHQVQSYEVKVPGTEAFGDRLGATVRRKRRYECVDCEKVFDDREEFKDKECYEVL